MKKLNLFVCMSAMLVTGAYAFSPLFEDFESGSVGDTFSNWIGDASIVATQSVATAGIPGSQTPAGNAKVLSVEGTVSNNTMFAGMASSTDTQIDLLVKVAKPDEALELPTEDVGNVKIAVGIDTNGALNVYCNGTSGLGFYPVSTNLTENAWVRVSLNFKDARCQVLLNGDLCINPNGYSDSTGGSSGEGGAWYQLPGDKNNSTAVTALKIVGTTAIDDVYTAQNSEGISIDDSVTAAGTIGGNNVEVKKSWLVKQNIASADVNSNAPDFENSGLTIAEKYVCGLDVNDNQKIKLVDIQPDTADDDKLKFTVPGKGPQGGYSFVLEQYTNAAATEDKKEISFGANSNTATVDLSDNFTGDDKVKYYRVKVVPES